MADIDRDAAGCAQKWVQNRLVIILLIDDVAYRSRAGELQNDSVHPADVIGQKKKPAVRQVFQTERVDPVKATHQWATNGIEGAFGARRRRHRL